MPREAVFIKIPKELIMQCLIDGAAVHVETAGSGDVALLLVHGACHDHRAWSPLLDALGDCGIALYAPDLPGHGASAGPALGDVTELGSWLLRLLDACGLARCALAGHSMGSLVALHAAALAPQRVSHLALVGSAWPMRVAPRLLELARQQPDEALQRVAAWSQRADAPAERAALDLEQMRQVQRAGADANLIALDLAACDAYAEGEQRAAQVRARCALLLGEHDRMTPPSAAQSLLQALPQPQLTLFDSGHDLMHEVPQALAAALRELLAG